MEFSREFENEIKEMIIDRLDNLEELAVYYDEVTDYIFQSEFADGSLTYDRYQSIQWLCKYYDDVGDIIHELVDELGYSMDDIPSFWDEPEKLQIWIVDSASRKLLCNCDWFEELYEACDYGELTWTDELIDELKDNL